MKTFFSDDRGAISVIAALALAVVLVFVGMAVDYSRVINVRSTAQQEIDAAALAAVAGQDDEAARELVSAYLSNSKRNWQEFQVTRTPNGSAIELRITGKLEITTPFLAFAGVPKMQPVLSSSAESGQVPVRITMTPNMAYGYSAKIVQLHKVSDAGDEVVFTASYTPTDLSGANSRGTGNVVMSPANGTVDLGNYTDLYMEMQVTDYQSGAVTIFRTNDPATARQLYVNGKALSQPLPVTRLVSCTSELDFAWEDSLRSDELKQQDWFWKVAAACGASSAGPRRLTR